MDLKSYLNSLSPQAQEKFCSRVGTTIGYLRKALSKGQRIGPEIAVAIEEQSCGDVTRKELLPDTWHLIWPELRPDILHPSSLTQGDTFSQALGAERESL